MVDLEARPGPAATHRHRDQVLRSLRRPPHQWGLVCWRVAWRVGLKPGQAPPPPTGTATRPRRCPRVSQPGPTGTPSLTPRPSLPSFLNPHAISHAIPPTLLQTFNLDRWNCNVFRLCWNFSQSNCMRLFGGRLRTPPRAPQPGPHPRLGHTSAKKTRPARLHQRPHAKKFAQHRHNCPKSAYFHSQGELFRGLARNRLLLGEFFRADGCHSRLTTPANHLA